MTRSRSTTLDMGLLQPVDTLTSLPEIPRSPASPIHRRSQSLVVDQEIDNLTEEAVPKEEPIQSSRQNIWAVLYSRYPNLNITLISITLWYAFSMSISVYNRWMFSTSKLDFSFPILITSFHQLILTFLSVCTLLIFPRFRIEKYGDTTYTMPLKDYATKIFPCSVASAGDIGLGNTAFRFITLSLYTMVKTSSLIFVLMWGVFFKLEKLNLKISMIVTLMVFGVSMMIYGQHDDPESVSARELLKPSHIFLGVTLVLLAACMSGLRWALTQIMLKKNKHTRNPILTMMYISPGMFFVLLMVGSAVEGVGEFLHAPIWENKGAWGTIGLMIIPGFLAFFMTISEFVLLQYASLLTLSVAGIFKELLTIFLSWIVFGDTFSLINGIGLLITFTDILWYNKYRFDQNEITGKDDIELVDVEMNDLNVMTEYSTK